MAAFDQVLRWLDLLGVAVFAASGALVASRKRMDAVGFVVIGAATGLGGGTLRDLLLGRAPVSWLRAPEPLAACAAAALLVFSPRTWWRAASACCSGRTRWASRCSRSPGRSWR